MSGRRKRKSTKCDSIELLHSTAGLCLQHWCLLLVYSVWKSKYLNLCYYIIKIAKITILCLNLLSKMAQCPFKRPLMLYSSSACKAYISWIYCRYVSQYIWKKKKKNSHVPFLFHPFIHPPPYQDPGSSGSTLIRAAQASFSRATSSERLLGHPEAFPDQLEYYNPSRVFWASSQSDVPRIPPWGGFRETS